MINERNRPSYIKKTSYFDSNMIGKEDILENPSYLSNINNSYEFSGVDKKEYSSHISDVSLFLLNNNLDIFSDISSSYFEQNKTDEQSFYLSNFLVKFKNKYLDTIKYLEINNKLPKVTIDKDEDEALILNILTNKYRLYVNFEKEISKSFYGYLFMDSDSSMKMNTEKYSPSNENEVIDLFIKSILYKAIEK